MTLIKYEHVSVGVAGFLRLLAYVYCFTSNTWGTERTRRQRVDLFYHGI